MNPIPNDNDNDGRIIKKKPIGFTYHGFRLCFISFFFFCDEIVEFFVVRFNVLNVKKKAIRTSTRFGQKDIVTGDRWKISISDLNGVRNTVFRAIFKNISFLDVNTFVLNLIDLSMLEKSLKT